MRSLALARGTVMGLRGFAMVAVALLIAGLWPKKKKAAV
jgi:hypothetical protein